ncbi:MAG TPA: outer membrane beta-barrel protein, partial [Flavisolibacter sp.]|nr:outer membrane beta-barrel protein [Flavisolibacter sp.]
AITRWWTNNFSLNVFSDAFNGVVNGTPVSLTATSFSVNGSQQFTLFKTTTAELSGAYRSPGVEGVIKMKSRGMLMAGLGQQLWKNKATLRLTVRDIFYTQIARATAAYGNVDVAFRESGDSRVLNIGFTYRFSKGKTGGPRKKATGSANEEQNRVGVGE